MVDTQSKWLSLNLYVLKCLNNRILQNKCIGMQFVNLIYSKIIYSLVLLSTKLPVLAAIIWIFFWNHNQLWIDFWCSAFWSAKNFQNILLEILFFYLKLPIYRNDTMLMNHHTVIYHFLEDSGGLSSKILSPSDPSKTGLKYFPCFLLVPQPSDKSNFL